MKFENMNTAEKAMMRRHCFGENQYEAGMCVVMTEKYDEARLSVCRMIENTQYGLLDSDFWILKRQNSTGNMEYNGLIITHAGCQKIGRHLAIDPRGFRRIENGYSNSLVYEYIDDNTYQVGEVNSGNCSYPWPYAMAYKRCYDRVVLEKARLAEFGIFSESESDEFGKMKPETYLSKEKLSTEAEAVRQSGLMQTNPFPLHHPVSEPVPERIKMPENQTVLNTSVTNSIINSVAPDTGRDLQNAANQVVLKPEAEITQKETGDMTLDEAMNTAFIKGPYSGTTIAEILNREERRRCVTVLRATSAARMGGKDSIAAKVVLQAMNAGAV